MAARFLVPGGNGQWNSTTNWSATSGGAAGASVPVAADTVTLDSASGSAGITVNVVSACTSIVATTGYTGTLTMDSTLTVSSTVTFVAGMTYAGAGTLILSGAGSYTSGGISISGTVRFNATVIHTLLDTWNVDTVSVSTTTGSITVNSAAGIVLNTKSLDLSTFTSGTFTGTTKIVLVGNGVVTTSAGWTGGVTNDVDINSITTTFTSNFRYSTGTLKYVAGTITSNVLILRGAATLDTAGMSWSDVSLLAGTYTITLNSNLNINFNLTVPSTTSVISFSGSFVVNALETIFPAGTNTVTLNGGTINTASLTSTTLTSGSVSGTTKFVIVGIGVVSFPAGMSGSINNNIDINSTSTVFSGNFRYNGGTITYIAGAIDVTNSTLVLTSAATLNTAGMYWGTIQLPVTLTITLGSNLNCNTLRPSAAVTVTFSGAFVVNTNDLNIAVTISAITFNGSTINTASFTSTTLSSGSVAGTTKIVLVGSGTVSFPSGWTGSINSSIDINSTSTVFSGNFRYNGGTIRYIAGAIDVTNSTLVLTSSATLNTTGMDWGNVTINAVLTLTLTSAFTCSGTFTIPSSNLTVVGTGFWTRVGNLTFTGTTNTLALLNNLTVTGTLTTSTATTINGFSLLIASLNSVGTIAGTTAFVFNSTGTWSGTGTLTKNTSINTAGTLTISGTVNYRTGTLTYTAGTVDSSVGTLACTAASTLNTGGMTWTNVTLTGTQTLSSNLNVSGTTTITGTTTFVNAARFTQTGTLQILNTAAFTLINNITVLNTFISTNNGAAQTMTGFQIICNGGIYTSGSGNISGTTTILLNGTGSWTSAGRLDLNAIRNNTTINTTGTITFDGHVHFNTGTLTYTAGTVVTTGSSLTCYASTTLNTNGISWDNIVIAGATITLSSNLTVTGNTTIGTGNTTFVNTGRFTQTGSLTLNGVATLTLINNITVLNDIISINNTSAQVINGFQITCNSGLSGDSGGSLGGTTALLLNGTGTWSSTTSIQFNTTINTAGTITVTGNIYFNTRTLTYTAGTVITAGSTLNCLSATTLNTNGITWDNVRFSGTQTLTSNLNVTGTTTITGTTTFVGTDRFTQTNTLVLFNDVALTLINNFTVLGDLITQEGTPLAGRVIDVNGFQLSIGGSLVLGGSYSSRLSGTTSLVLAGTGTLSGAVWLVSNLNINTTGTITVSGDIYKDGGTLTYTAGTVTTTGSTLFITSSSTVSTSGIVWNNVTVFGQYATITINSLLSATGMMTLYIGGVGPLNFVGTHGFTAGSVQLLESGLWNTSDTPTLKFASSNQYAITNAFYALVGRSSTKLNIASGTPGVQAKLSLAPGAVQGVGYANVVDIDSSGGQKIWAFQTTLSNTINWQQLDAVAASGGGGGGSYTWVS